MFARARSYTCFEGSLLISQLRGAPSPVHHEIDGYSIHRPCIGEEPPTAGKTPLRDLRFIQGKGGFGQDHIERDDIRESRAGIDRKSRVGPGTDCIYQELVFPVPVRIGEYGGRLPGVDKDLDLTVCDLSPDKVPSHLYGFMKFTLFRRQRHGQLKRAYLWLNLSLERENTSFLFIPDLFYNLFEMVLALLVPGRIYLELLADRNERFFLGPVFCIQLGDLVSQALSFVGDRCQRGGIAGVPEPDLEGIQLFEAGGALDQFREDEKVLLVHSPEVPDFARRHIKVDDERVKRLRELTELLQVLPGDIHIPVFKVYDNGPWCVEEIGHEWQ